MPRTIDLTGLRAGVRRRGGWVNSRRVTDTFLDDVINSAIAEVWDLVIEKWPDFYALQVTSGITEDQEDQSLPLDFYKLRKVELLWAAPDQWVRLRPHDLAASHIFANSSGGRTFRYRLQGSFLFLVPAPTSPETLRITYIPWATKLVSPSAIFDGINGNEELVMQTAVLRIKQEQDLDTSGTEKEIARLKARIRTDLDGQDAAEPFYLDPRGPRNEADDEEDVWR